MEKGFMRFPRVFVGSECGFLWNRVALGYLGTGWRIETSTQELTVGAPIRNGKHRPTDWTGSGRRGGAGGSRLGVELITAAGKTRDAYRARKAAGVSGKG